MKIKKESAKIGVAIRNSSIVNYLQLVQSMIKKTCQSHTGVFDFGCTGSTITDTFQKKDSQKLVIN